MIITATQVLSLSVAVLVQEVGVDYSGLLPEGFEGQRTAVIMVDDVISATIL